MNKPRYWYVSFSEYGNVAFGNSIIEIETPAHFAVKYNIDYRRSILIHYALELTEEQFKDLKGKL